MLSLDAFIKREVGELRRIWKGCSRDRSQNAFMPYLEAVFRFRRALGKRQRVKKAGRRIAEIYEFKLRDDMHSLRCIIEASSKNAPDRLRSEMTQALRYALSQRWRANLLERIAENGGIKGCADKFGKLNKRARYSRTKGRSTQQERQ
jgi:hypothetical protein